MGVGGRQLRRTGYAEGGEADKNQGTMEVFPSRNNTVPYIHPDKLYQGGVGDPRETERWRRGTRQAKTTTVSPCLAEGGEVESLRTSM